MSNSIATLRYHLAFYVVFKLQVATKLLLDSMLLDSAHSVVTVQLNRLIVNGKVLIMESLKAGLPDASSMP